MVCSRDDPAVPPPFHDHDPPLTGCGPILTESPELTVTLEACCQLPPFTWIYEVIAVCAQFPLAAETEVERAINAPSATALQKKNVLFMIFQPIVCGLFSLFA